MNQKMQLTGKFYFCNSRKIIWCTQDIRLWFLLWQGRDSCYIKWFPFERWILKSVLENACYIRRIPSHFKWIKRPPKLQFNERLTTGKEVNFDQMLEKLGIWIFLFQICWHLSGGFAHFFFAVLSLHAFILKLVLQRQEKNLLFHPTLSRVELWR